MADNMKELEAEIAKNVDSHCTACKYYLLDNVDACVQSGSCQGELDRVETILALTFHGSTVREVLEKWAEGELVELTDKELLALAFQAEDIYEEVDSEHAPFWYTLGGKLKTALGYDPDDGAHTITLASGESREGSDE